MSKMAALCFSFLFAVCVHAQTPTVIDSMKDIISGTMSGTVTEQKLQEYINNYKEQLTDLRETRDFDDLDVGNREFMRKIGEVEIRLSIVEDLMSFRFSTPRNIKSLNEELKREVKPEAIKKIQEQLEGRYQELRRIQRRLFPTEKVALR